ncbi:MAG: hypothetical protein IIA07_07670 [Proteobacteria bacterium]|nr:hypothetical protein [Pseudomonadota bacterium]
MTSKLIIVLIAAVSLIGCTSMRPMSTQETDLRAQLEMGDHLVVFENTGRIVDMTLTEIDGDILRGRLTDGSMGPTHIDIENIEKIEVEKISGVKTTLAVVGGIIVIVPLAALALLAVAMGGV